MMKVPMELWEITQAYVTPAPKESLPDNNDPIKLWALKFRVKNKNHRYYHMPVKVVFTSTDEAARYADLYNISDYTLQPF